MVYGEKHYLERIKDGRFKNASEDCVGPASLDLRLGNSFLFPVLDQRVVLGEEVKYNEYVMEDDEIVWLDSGDFCLATTKEWMKLSKDDAGFIQGRSSIGRAGLTVENAGFVDPGFEGHITLELKNDTCYPIGLKPGYRVAQIVLMECKDAGAYTGKYNGQVKATGSRMHQDAEAQV